MTTLAVAEKNETIAFLLSKARNAEVLRVEDGPDELPRISIFLDLRDREVVETLVSLAYRRNRNLIAMNSAMIAQEIEKRRFFGTNIIGIAYDPEDDMQELALINGNHTLKSVLNAHKNGVPLADPYFNMFIWVKPDHWDTREYERLDFIPTMYTRYDCGKNKTIQNQMDALSTADNLGLTKTQLTKLNVAIRSVIWGGRGTAPSPEAKAALASPVDQDRLAHKYGPLYCEFLDTTKISKTREKELRLDDRYDNLQRLLRVSSVTAAFLSVAEGLENAGEMHVLELVHQFFRCMARGELEVDSPISALYVFMQNPKRSALFTKNHISRQIPTYMATLYCLMAYIHKQKMSVEELNQFVLGNNTSDIDCTTEVVFGEFEYTLKAVSAPFNLRQFVRIGGGLDMAA